MVDPLLFSLGVLAIVCAIVSAAHALNRIATTLEARGD